MKNKIKIENKTKLSLPSSTLMIICLLPIEEKSLVSNSTILKVKTSTSRLENFFSKYFL